MRRFSIHDEFLGDVLGLKEAEAERQADERRACLDRYRALVRVNHQVHHEVSDVFFKQNIFHFWMVHEKLADAVGNWLHRVDDGFVQKFRRIKIIQAHDPKCRSVDIELTNDDQLYKITAHGEPWDGPERVPKYIGQTQVYKQLSHLVGDAKIAAEVAMSNHARYLKKYPDQFIVPVPLERGRARTRKEPTFRFDPDLLREILSEVVSLGELEVTIGEQRRPPPEPRCYSPDYCDCDDCERWRRNEPDYFIVSDECRGSPYFVADYQRGFLASCRFGRSRSTRRRRRDFREDSWRLDQLFEPFEKVVEACEVEKRDTVL